MNFAIVLELSSLKVLVAFECLSSSFYELDFQEKVFVILMSAGKTTTLRLKQKEKKRKKTKERKEKRKEGKQEEKCICIRMHLNSIV